ncbi:MAG: hypothetical protein EOO26_00650 [Comamonadaceae bacterium]|nr:MAG: hypothetical protein EOO26_00650 [Comamonadaceae bacterium]
MPEALLEDFRNDTLALCRDFRMGDVPTIVLSLYGAMALPSEVNPERNLGQFASTAIDGEHGRKTLVLVDSHRTRTGAATLKKAIAKRNELMGGWDHVVVLGWKFGPSFGKTVARLDDARLEVLMIPPDLIARLKKKVRRQAAQ